MTQADNYIDALEEAVKMARTSIAIFGAPLALLVAQLRFVSTVECWPIKLLATLVFLIFFVGTYLAWSSAVRTQLLLAKAKLTRDGQSRGNGFHYLAYVEEMIRRSGQEISEEGLVQFHKEVRKLVTILMFSGYGLMLLFVLAVIWSTPQ